MENFSSILFDLFIRTQGLVIIVSIMMAVIISSYVCARLFKLEEEFYCWRLLTFRFFVLFILAAVTFYPTLNIVLEAIYPIVKLNYENPFYTWLAIAFLLAAARPGVLFLLKKSKKVIAVDLISLLFEIILFFPIFDVMSSTWGYRCLIID